MSKTNFSTKELRNFGIIVGLAFSAFGAVIPFLKGANISFFLCFIAAILIMLGLFIPNLLATPYKWWYKLAVVLGWINTRIVLGLVFFLILTPIGLTLRLISKNHLKLKFDRCLISYREKASARSINHMEVPF